MDLFSIIPVCSNWNTEEAELLLVDGVTQRLEKLHVALDLRLGLEVIAVEEVKDCKKQG